MGILHSVSLKYFIITALNYSNVKKNVYSPQQARPQNRHVELKLYLFISQVIKYGTMWCLFFPRDGKFS
jgi:hypothetical protein